MDRELPNLLSLSRRETSSIAKYIVERPTDTNPVIQINPLSLVEQLKGVIESPLTDTEWQRLGLNHYKE